MRTPIYPPIQISYWQRRYMGIPAMLSKLVSLLRKNQESQNPKRDTEAPYISEWSVLIFHDIQCSESIHHAGGVEHIPMDLEEIPGFLKEPTLPPLEYRAELDRSKGDNYQCGIFDKFASTLDCRYYWTEVELHVLDPLLERSRDLQSPSMDKEDDWPEDESDQLLREILLKRRNEIEGEESLLGWTDPDPDV